MHVHCSNILINISRIIKTQILNRYRQEWEQSGSPVVERPRDRTCSPTRLYIFLVESGTMATQGSLSLAYQYTIAYTIVQCMHSRCRYGCIYSVLNLVQMVHLNT
jgi:hypothetical protein